MPKPRVLVIGEALVDIVRESAGAHIEHVGGSPANVAMGLARLDHRVRLATTLGRDQRGERIADHLERHGVKVAKGSFTDEPTSTAQVTFDADQNASYEFDISWNLAPVKVGKRVGHLHAGSLATALAPGAARAREAMSTHRHQVTLSYDPNIRPGIMGDLDRIRADVEEIIPIVDVIKASSDDIEVLYPGRAAEDVLDHWLGLGPALAVLTQGPDGVIYRSRGGGVVSLPTLAPSVVDTVGAGDSFMAGLISGLLAQGLLGGPEGRAALAQASEDEIRHAIDRGLATSGVTVGRAGAYAPSLDEL